MKLQTKTFGIIVLTTVCLIASLHLVASNILSTSYGQLESTDVTHNVELVNNTVYTHELAQLRSSAFDWAFWNDSYNFVQTNSSDFIQANIVSSSFTDLQVNYILYVNSTNGGSDLRVWLRPGQRRPDAGPHRSQGGHIGRQQDLELRR